MLANDIHIKPNNRGFDMKRFEIWANNMQNWEKKKKKKINLLKDKQQSELERFENHFPYNPKLNSFRGFSKSFIEGNVNEGKARFERMHNDYADKMAKIEKIKADLTPSFEPKINNSIPKFFRNSSAGSIKSRNLRSKFLNKRSTSMTKTKFSSVDMRKDQEREKGRKTKSQKSKREISTSKSFDLDIHQKKRLSKLIDKMSNGNSVFKNPSEALLYQINVQNNSSWQKTKECLVMYTPKFSNILSNLTRNKSYADRTSSDINNSIQFAESNYESRKNIILK